MPFDTNNTMAQTHKPGKKFSMKPLSTQVKTVVLLIHPAEFKTTILCMVCMVVKFGFSPWGKNWDAKNTCTRGGNHRRKGKITQ